MIRWATGIQRRAERKTGELLDGKRSPDKAKWSLSAQSSTVVDKTRDPDTGYVVSSPANVNAVYPWPR
jgi:hypothetical protein